MTDVIIRVATRRDIAAIDALLAQSYPVLLKPDYPPSTLVTALPLISRAQPGLVTSGTYYVAQNRAGVLVAAGGWTCGGPGQPAPEQPGLGHIRHVVCDHRQTRRGFGRALMRHTIKQARAARVLSCFSTLTAVPFYAALGFETLGPIQITLRPGIDFPAMRMWLDLDARD